MKNSCVLEADSKITAMRSSCSPSQGQQNVQIQEMRAELDEMSATHNRMESIVFNLVDDMRDLKGTSRLQYKQFQTVSAELNHKTDKIRHENKKVLDRIRACQVSLEPHYFTFLKRISRDMCACTN